MRPIRAWLLTLAIMLAAVVVGSLPPGPRLIPVPEARIAPIRVVSIPVPEARILPIPARGIPVPEVRIERNQP